MAPRKTHERWLSELANLFTAPGKEQHVVDWVTKWVARRDDLSIRLDSGGNVLVEQKGRKRHAAVVAVAHMDHPAFVVADCEGETVSFEFRGGVDAPYFQRARMEFESGGEATVLEYDPKSKRGAARLSRGPVPSSGEIGRWVFRDEAAPESRFTAPACDDLAGVAAALCALDRSRGDSTRRHFCVLLTRAEEVGLVGAMHAAGAGTVARDSRVLSIETSRELPNARIGDGPIVRVGDAVTAFDGELTNKITSAARSSGMHYQRSLMDGGGCEATAFGLLGYRATGLCVALGNWHNRGNLDLVERGKGKAIPRREEISLEDFHGLVELLHLSVPALDAEDPARTRIEEWYSASRRYLD
jgi:endoglucanase